MKSGVYPEYTALIAAARLTGKPVHWMSSRSEAFSTDNQGRDGVTEGELALDERGKFLALRVRHLANMGAYMTSAGARLATNNFSRCFPTVYRVPHIDASVRCVFTHTTPTGPYRGAGRPEANYLMERLVEEAARVTGIDRVTLRKRNFIPRSAMPYKTDVQTTYDSGEFPAIFDKALALADHAGFKKRKREAAKRGKYRGFGISCFLEHSGGVPTEGALLEFPGGEKLVIALGVQSTGQGHATVYPRLVAEKLGIRSSQVTHRHGDSSFEIKGGPSVASRSTITAGTATVRADRDHARESQDDRGAGAGSGRERHRLSQRPVRSGRHRPDDPAVHAGRTRERDEEARRDRGKPRHQGRRSTRRRLSRMAATSPKSRSIPTPATPNSSPIARSTIAATCSITRWSRARSMAGWRRGWDRPCSNTRSTRMAAASS